MTPHEFDALQLLLSRVEAIERRIDLMDAELTDAARNLGNTQAKVDNLSHEVRQMTDSFAAFRNALYAAAATILAAAILVVILGQHP